MSWNRIWSLQRIARFFINRPSRVRLSSPHVCIIARPGDKVLPHIFWSASLTYSWVRAVLSSYYLIKKAFNKQNTGLLLLWSIHEKRYVLICPCKKDMLKFKSLYYTRMAIVDTFSCCVENCSCQHEYRLWLQLFFTGFFFAQHEFGRLETINSSVPATMYTTHSVLSDIAQLKKELCASCL